MIDLKSMWDVFRGKKPWDARGNPINNLLSMSQAGGETGYRGVPKGIVFVDDFGAKGDGSADDTSAINNAISNLSENQMLVFRPGATYAVSDRLPFRKSNVIVEGQGATIQLTESLPNWYNPLFGDDSAANKQNITIRNLQIDMQDYDGRAMVIGGGGVNENILIRDCFFTNVLRSSILISGSWITVCHNHIINPSSNGSITVKGWADRRHIKILNNEFYNAPDSSRAIVVHADGKNYTDIEIAGNHIEQLNRPNAGDVQPIFVGDAASGTNDIKRVLIHDNQILNTGFGDPWGTNDAADCSAIHLGYNVISAQIYNNRITNNRNAGIDVSRGSDIIVANNLVKNTEQGCGIFLAVLEQVEDGYVVEGNKLVDIGTEGIIVSSTANGLLNSSINGNVLENIGTYGTYPAIKIQGSSDYNTYTGNVFHNITGVYFGGNGLGTNSLDTSNIKN